MLDPKLQDGKKLPKWQACARRGQCLGVSPDHSRTIGRILNLRSGFISPQYHVIYDDLFSTVPNAESGGTLEPELDGPFWRKLIATGYESLLPDDDDDPIPALNHDWLTDAELCARQRDHTPPRLHPSSPLPVPFPSVTGGTLDQPSHPPQQQPRPDRSASFAPEGATQPPVPKGADDDMEIVFTDDPELVPPTLQTTTTMIYLALQTLTNMGMANGIRNRTVTSLTNAFGRPTHAFNKALAIRNKMSYENS